jgi:hypothetical protein
MNVGFTGSRKGMADKQFEIFQELLNEIILREPQSIFSHGQCIGADSEATSLAYDLGFRVIAHPGFSPKNPSYKGYRGSFNNNHETHPEKPFLIRDHDIVDSSDILVATPKQQKEILRSGTWATIRYGQKTKMVIIIFPDGITNVSICKK